MLTFVTTAIEAYEFPKLMPTTTGGGDAMGVEAPPFDRGFPSILVSVLRGRAQ